VLGENRFWPFAVVQELLMSRRVEYLLLPDKVVASRSLNMTEGEFQKYARERLMGEAKRITQPYDPNYERVEALRLMDGERELCRVELGDVMILSG
jgi:hypothetical protein